MNTIVILGGGEGLRLKKILGHGCKFLAPFNGVPWIATAIKILNKCKTLTALIVNINNEHLSHFKSFNISGNFDLNIEFSRKGLGFPLLSALQTYKSGKNIVLLLGDVFFDSSFLRALDDCFILLDDNKVDFITFTRSPRSASVDDYDILLNDKNIHKVVPISNPASNKHHFNQIGGCLIIKKKSLQPFLDDLDKAIFGFRDLHNFLFDKNLCGVEYFYNGYFEDFGTPERYKEVTEHVNNF